MSDHADLLARSKERHARLGGWTEERVSILKKLWRDGLSASQIAKQLGGLTRNAVIGKLTRLKMTSPGRRSPRTQQSHLNGRPKTSLPKVAPKPAEAKLLAPEVARDPYQNAGVAFGTRTRKKPVIELVAAFDVTPTARLWTSRRHGECRWPVGDPAEPADQLSCCAPCGEARYCEPHRKIAKARASFGMHAATTADLVRMARRFA